MSRIILLTGGTGFLGRCVIENLQRQGLRVRLVVREGSEFKNQNITCIESIVVSKDIFLEKSAWWQRACDGVDTVIHMAWYVEHGKYLYSPKNMNCLAGTLELAMGASISGVKKLVGIGTCLEYDLSGERAVDINTALKPLTPYSATKAAAFLALSQYLSSVNIDFAWCRLFYLYGKNEDSRRLIPYLHARLSRGESVDLRCADYTRDFLDVDDAAKIIVKVALGLKVGPVNICSGVPITIRKIAEDIADQYQGRSLLNFQLENSLDEPRYVVGVKLGD